MLQLNIYSSRPSNFVNFLKCSNNVFIRTAIIYQYYLKI